MRFQAYFTPKIKIFLWIMSVASLACVGIAIAVLCGAKLEISHAQAVLMVSVFSCSTVLTVSLATIHYKVDSNAIKLKWLFFDVLGGRIQIKNILNIVVKDVNFYISYLWKGQDPVIACLLIKETRFEELKKLLTSYNQNIQYFCEEQDATANSK